MSVGGPLLELAVGLTGDSMQDVLLGGAIVSAVGAALVAGAKVSLDELRVIHSVTLSIVLSYIVFE